MLFRQWQSSNSEGEHYTITVHSTAVVICAGYGFYHLLWDSRPIGLFALLSAFAALASVFDFLRGRHSTVIYGTFFASQLAALALTSYLYGVRGILLLFPIINGLYYIFQTTFATVFSCFFVSICLIAALQVESMDVILRSLPAFVLTFIFSASFTRSVSKRNHDLNFFANHDALTEIHNRRGFLSWLTSYLKASQKSGQQVTLYFFDLDGFKQINDGYGHDIGDKVLVSFTKRLISTLRANELVQKHGSSIQNVGRLSGDEFVLALCGHKNEQEAINIGNRLLAAFDEPIVIDKHVIHLTMSIGVSFASEVDYQLDQLIASADRAMYQAKYNGKSRLQVCSKESATP